MTSEFDGESMSPEQVASPEHSTPSIADRYADILAPLNSRRRHGLVALLSQGYYEGWRPSREEVQALVERELRKSV